MSDCKDALIESDYASTQLKGQFAVNDYANVLIVFTNKQIGSRNGRYMTKRHMNQQLNLKVPSRV